MSYHPSQLHSQQQEKHYHPMNVDKICCLRHVIELCNFFKSQGRYNEAGEALVIFFQRAQGLSMILNDDTMDFNLKKNIFLLCNDHASRFTVAGDLEKAQILLDKAQAISHEMPSTLKATLFSNISCYYEKVNDDQSAMLYLEQALQIDMRSEEQPLDQLNPAEILGMAINHNNLSVIELKSNNFQQAFKQSKKAVVMMEPLLFSEIKQRQEKELKVDKTFLDKLQVLLIAYFNLGVSQCKVGNIEYAKTVFDHGFKMAKKFLGEDHYFAQRFQRRINKPLGSVSQPQPQNSLKQEMKMQSHQNNRLPVSNSQQEVILDVITSKNSVKPHQDMSIISKGEKRKIITNNRQLVKDNSGSGIESSSSHGATMANLNSQIGYQTKNSRKKSELMAMVKENQLEEMVNSHNQEDPDLNNASMISMKQLQDQNEQELKAKKEQLLKQLEEEFRQKQVELEKEQENKMKEILSTVNQNQTDISKKWEDLQKKQEEFERKIMMERNEILQERIRLKEETEKADKEKLLIVQQKQKEEKVIAEEKAKMKNSEDKVKQLEGTLSDAMDKFQKEREKYMKEYQDMMKNLATQQEKQQQMLMQQQQEVMEQKKLLILEEQKIQQSKEIQIQNANLSTPQVSQQQDEPKLANPLIRITTIRKPQENKQPEQKKELKSEMESPSKLSTVIVSNPPVLAKMQSSSNMIKDIRKSVTDQPSSQFINTPGFSNQLQNSTKEEKKLDGQKIEELKLDSSERQDFKESVVKANEKVINEQQLSLTLDQLNDIVEEDQKLYDASILLSNDQLMQQFKIPKIVSQIIYCDGLYYKMYCEGSLGKDQKPMFKIYGICEDSKIQVHEEELSFFEFKSILKLLIVKDILPPFIPIKNIRTFTDMCRYFVFPFMLTTSEQKEGDNSHTSPNSPLNLDSVGGSQNQSQTNRGGTQWRYIELWGRPPGLLNSQAHIMILKNLCNVSLHFTYDHYFKVAITSLDAESANSLYLDLSFDKTSFKKYFQVIDSSTFERDGQTVPLVDGEIKLQSLKIIDKDFLFEVEPGLKAFESYLLNEYGQEITFPYLVYERTGLVYQLRIKDEGSQQELWCLRDDSINQCFKVQCRTLYEVRLKKHLTTLIERVHNIDYSVLQNLFGVYNKKEEIDRSQLIMLTAYYLQTLFLHMPTMELNKGDAEDSDYEEEVNINNKKIECIVHIRKLLDVQGDKYPLTIQLLGYDNTSYLGVKVSAYNPQIIKELGFFFTVNQQYWELTDEQKQNVPKRKTMKTEVLNDYYHLSDVLKKQGFAFILNNLSLKKKSERVLRWKGPYGETNVDVFESYFSTSSMI